MSFSILDLGRLSALGILIFTSAWITIEKDLGQGIIFFIVGSAVIVSLFIIEKLWVEYKSYHGIKE